MRASISVKMFLYDNFNDISESAGVLTLTDNCNDTTPHPVSNINSNI